MAESVAARYDRLNRRADELTALPGHLGPTVTPTHRAAAEVFTELIRFGSTSAGSAKTPLHMRTLMRTLEKSQPLLLDGLAKMPPESIREFMAGLVEKLQRIVDAPDDPAGHAAK